MKRISIVGSDVTALLAAYYFTRRGHHVTIFHDTFRDGGIGNEASTRPQTVRSSRRFVELLKTFGLIHSTYCTRVGMLLKDQIGLYPNILREIGREKATKVRSDLYYKSRLIAPESTDRLTDFEATIPKSAIRFDWPEFVRRLKLRTATRSEKVIQVDLDRVQTNLGSYPFDHAIVTLPLWKAREIVSWPLPEALGVPIHHAVVSPNTRDRFAAWDSVHLPYTPERLVYRVIQHEDGYHALFSGGWSEDTSDRLFGDLNFLFPGGWHLQRVDRNVPGFILPLFEIAEWPSNVAPLGRYAAWDELMTLDRCLLRLCELQEQWGL